MISIRRGTFETNSSSTHSIGIPINMKSDYPNYVRFNCGEFGWEWEEVDPADYLYTALCDLEDYDRIEELKNILKKHNIEYYMNESKDGYIDHSYETIKFIEDIFSDEDKLLNFIFYGIVFTGNDNSENEGFLTRFEKEIEYDSFVNGKWVTKSEPNEYYDEMYTKYDWYFKGN